MTACASGLLAVASIITGIFTYGLSQSNHHFLAGGCFCDPTYNSLDSVHPDFELHFGSEVRGPVVVSWPQHY